MSRWFPRLASDEIVRTTSIESIHAFEALSSTSDYVLQNLEALAGCSPALVICRTQTQGRGRRQRSWFADEGALTFSILLDGGHFSIRQAHWPRLALVAGIAMCHALESQIPEHRCQLKWPNDIYLDQRKICGILVENRDQFLCVGIGVNVNNSLDDAPADVQQRAISLTDISHQLHFLPQIVLDFATHWDRVIPEIEQDLQALLPYWNSRCLLFGRTLELVQNEKSVFGKCEGINADGTLRLQTENQLLSIHSGEVVRW